MVKMKYDYRIALEKIEQEIKIPTESKDKKNGKFTIKKIWNNDIIESFERLGNQKKADKIRNCANVLEYSTDTENGDPKLSKAYFCKDRLCNICSWRRSLKIYGQVSQIMDIIEKDYSFIFVTLTIKNCSAADLIKNINILQKGFKTLMQKDKTTKGIKGYFKSIEITTHPENPSYWEFHPHIHAIFAVNESYFHSRDYISQENLIKAWRKNCNLDYDPTVDIRKIRKGEENKEGKKDYSIKKAICEAAKYAVKARDISQHDYNTIDREVKTLSEALEGRRVCSFGGIFKETAKKLDLDDMLEGDLVNTDNQKIRKDVGYMIIRMKWRAGFGYNYDGCQMINTGTNENDNQGADG